MEFAQYTVVGHLTAEVNCKKWKSFVHLLIKSDLQKFEKHIMLTIIQFFSQ